MIVFCFIGQRCRATPLRVKSRSKGRAPFWASTSFASCMKWLRFGQQSHGNRARIRFIHISRRAIGSSSGKTKILEYVLPLCVVTHKDFLELVIASALPSTKFTFGFRKNIVVGNSLGDNGNAYLQNIFYMKVPSPTLKRYIRRFAASFSNLTIILRTFCHCNQRISKT